MKNAHILLIEDDPAVARSLRDGLEREGYTVTWKDHGLDGVAFARESLPHLIILDVRLPDGSGFDFCRQLRASGLRQPILMLTVERDELDKVLGLEMGADDYVTKPYSLRELLSRVRAQLRRAYGEFSNAEADLLYVSDLVIDRGRGQVWRGTQFLALTPTEFRLLVFLAQHANQALSRGQIIDAVWGWDADMDSERAVNVHIRRLREKVEIDPANPALILTVPGVGYRLVTSPVLSP
ncbi:MAG: response regulator transcription factor [Chloroflexi bacterium]|jgi:DNA-binding response OmpR family regulator|nr:response regulator transcription factor [Chloroflexota bacterium]